MNKVFFYLLGVVLALSMIGCGSSAVAQKETEGYKIEVAANNFTGSEAYLAYYYGDKQYIKDTVPATAGSFVFEADTNLPGGIYLVVFPPKNTYFEIIVDKDQKFALETDTTDFVANMKVKGSKDNELFYKDLLYLADKRKEAQNIQTELTKTGDPATKAKLQEDQKKLNEEVMSYRKEFVEDNPDFLYAHVIKGMQDPEVPDPPKDENGNVTDSTFTFRYYKAHFFDDLDLADDRMLRTPVLYNRVNTYMERLTAKYIPDSVIKSVDYILDQMKDNETNFQFFLVNFLNKYAVGDGKKIMGMDAVYVHMVEKYYRYPEMTPWVNDSNREKMLERAVSMSPVLIGNTAPDFTVQDDKGTYQTLSQVQADWLIVYFWDYGCGHCKKVTPRLTETFKKYNLADKGVKIMTININGDVDEWKEKLGTYELNMEGAIINTEDIRRRSGSTQFYDINSTPRMFILDKNKIIKAKQIGVPQMLQVFSRELGFEVAEEDKVETDFSDIEEDEEGK
ncbi:MAG: redoxin domain-containing protein [Bacteroidota bacterium]